MTDGARTGPDTSGPAAGTPAAAGGAPDSPVRSLPDPSGASADPAVLLARYLDFFRDTVADKLTSLPEAERRRSRLPSGWTPVELASHLAHMERRWMVWGFLGEAVGTPWGDRAADGDRWHVPDDVSVHEVVERLREGGRRTTRLLGDHDLDDTARPGGRFEETLPTLAEIAFHVLQEYARHAGHLDVAVELAGGGTGE